MRIVKLSEVCGVDTHTQCIAQVLICHIGNRHGGWTISSFTDFCFLATTHFVLYCFAFLSFVHPFFHCHSFSLVFCILSLINLVSVFISIIFLVPFISFCAILLLCFAAYWMQFGDKVNVLLMCGCLLCLLSLFRLICCVLFVGRWIRK